MRCRKCGAELVAITAYVEAEFIRQHPHERPYDVRTMAPFPAPWPGAGGTMPDYPCKHEPERGETVIVQVTCPRCHRAFQGTAMVDGPEVDSFQCSHCGCYPILANAR